MKGLAAPRRSKVPRRVTDMAVKLISGRRFADARGFAWPALPDGSMRLSEKDERLPSLSQFDSPFPYDGVPLSLVEV